MGKILYFSHSIGGHLYISWGFGRRTPDGEVEVEVEVEEVGEVGEGGGFSDKAFMNSTGASRASVLSCSRI